MDNLYLSRLVAEMRPDVTGRNLSGLSMSGSDLTIDLRLPDNRVLLASLDPSNPSLLISSRESSVNDSLAPFILFLRKRLAGARLVSLSKDKHDRIVRFEFEKFDHSGDKSRSMLFLFMTGRSSTACLADASGKVEISLADREGRNEGDLLAFEEGELSKDDFLSGIGNSATEEEIIEKAFGSTSPLGPLHRREFLARCQSESPLEAFRSLLTEAIEDEPRAIVYSIRPLEEMGSRAINLKSSLLLSHFRQMRGRFESNRVRFAFGSSAQIRRSASAGPVVSNPIQLDCPLSEIRDKEARDSSRKPRKRFRKVRQP
jgi:hypothetical protein